MSNFEWNEIIQKMQSDEMPKDEYERKEDRIHTLRKLDKLRFAKFLTMIQNEPEKYPHDTNGWLEWLNQDAVGNTLDTL